MTSNKKLAYSGFIVASVIAILAVILNRDLTGAGVLVAPFASYGAFQAYRRAKEGERSE